MLTNEMKLQAFLKMRTRNYRASLRLEGLTPPQEPARQPALAASASAPKTKHAR
jgi:hypothetical protein